MTTLLHLLKLLWRGRVDHFLWIYFLMAAVTTVVVVWAVRSAASPPDEKDRETTVAARRCPLSGGAIAALVLVALILAAYLVLVLKWEAFADYDDSYFTLYSLRGIGFQPPIWAGSGRFFPLHIQEFNLVRHFTRSVAGYHAVPIVQLLILSCLLIFLDRALSITARATLSAVCLLMSSIVYSFTGLIFPERNVVFWLACLLFFVKLFEQSGLTSWAVAAALSAQNMIYYKETAFLLLLGFALGRLISRCRRADAKGWDYGLLKARESRLDLCLLFVGLCFFLYYGSVMFFHPSMEYARDYAIPWNEAILYYLKLDPLALVFVIVALTRAYLILRRRLTPLPFWDGLALGGLAYYAAFLYLRLCRPYYLAPVDFVAVLYAGRLLVLSWKGMPLWSKAATSLLAAAVLLQNVSLSAFHVYERENMLHAKAELADAIIAQSQSGAGRVQRLFFPFSSSYLMTEFASYLVYRGLNVEGYQTDPRSVSPYGVAIASPAFTKDGPCVDYRNFVSHGGSEPREGDLVIELPDDLESKDDFKPYRASGELLFSYDPRPRIPQWMNPELNYLRAASYRWRFAGLPDRWLHSSMILWK